MVLKSLSYFDDAEGDYSIDLIHKVSWTKVKKSILNAVNVYNKEL
jgi:hypothetical protein